MNNFKRYIRNVFCGWITFCLTLFSVGIYLGISSFSFGGMIGFLCLNFVVWICIESFVYKITSFKISKDKGIIACAIAAVFLLLTIINKDLAGRTIVLWLVSGLILIVFMWSFIEQTTRSTDKFAIALVAFGLVLVVLYFWQKIGTFSPDSYSYYEIAETIGNNFGKVGTIRQYTTKTDYNISFPYFYPCCVFVIDKITGLGRYSGVLFNVYIVLFTCVLFLYISKKFAKKCWCGVVAIFLLTATPCYWEEVCAARAIPVAIFLSAISFCLLAEIYFLEERKECYYLLIGIFAGALISTRFDGLVMAAYCVLLITLCNGKRIRHLFLYFAGIITAASPWLLYSWKNFGKVWISDNSGTAFLVTPTVPTRIIIPGDSTLTLFNAPSEWMHSLVEKTYHIIRSLCKCSYMTDVCILVCMLLMIYAVRKKKMTKEYVIVLAVTIIFYLGKTAMYILVGYADIRYHVETVVFVAFVFMMIAENLGVTIPKRKLLYGIVTVEIFVTVFSFRHEIKGILENGFTNILKSIEVEPDWVTALDDELAENIENPESGILFLGDGYTFGGWTDWKIYVNPSSYEWEKITYAMDNYMDVEYAVVPKEYINEDVIAQFDKLYAKTNLTDYYLFDLGVQ